MKKQPNVNSLWFWRQVRKEWNAKISIRNTSLHYISVFLCLNSPTFERAWLWHRDGIFDLAHQWHLKNRVRDCDVMNRNSSVLFNTVGDQNHIAIRSAFVKAMCKKFSQKA